MSGVPRSERAQIAIFGVRNAGKSSLLNAIAGRPVTIVSDVAGTTTDPVSKSMELGALGAVSFTDTAGLDDEGELGSLRVGRSLETLSWTDIALLATPLHKAPHPRELEAYAALSAAKKPIVVVGTFADAEPHPEKTAWLEGLAKRQGAHKPAAVLRANAKTGEGVDAVKDALMSVKDEDGNTPAEAGPLEGLVERGDIVLLVTPIDSAAPRGRLILPEAETLRDALDRGCVAMACRETELALAYSSLAAKPALVVTDSQAFAQVAAIIPADQRLTSFSILFARKKGELSRYEEGLRALEDLAAAKGEGGGISLLALEACTHNRTHEDIATVKIPALLEARTGRAVRLSVMRELGREVPRGEYDLAVICGGCMATRGKMLAQLDALSAAGVPALNFGMFLAWAHGVFPRALEPLV